MTQHELASLDEKWQYIQRMDFSQLIQKETSPWIPNPYGTKWQYDDLVAAIERYKRFLYLLVKYHDRFDYITPTLEIDEIWHQHILDTRRYHQDCLALFGHYLHHDPSFGMIDHEQLSTSTDQEPDIDYQQLYDYFQTTRMLYLIEFGDNLEDPNFERVANTIQAQFAQANHG